jgi:hypothetical protein
VASASLYGRSNGWELVNEQKGLKVRANADEARTL